MRVETITLQELVEWALVIAIALALASFVLRILLRKEQASSWRRSRRRCAQCGLLEEIPANAKKYGTCHVCGGVTSRGRSRKLG